MRLPREWSLAGGSAEGLLRIGRRRLSGRRASWGDAVTACVRALHRPHQLRQGPAHPPASGRRAGSALRRQGRGCTEVLVGGRHRCPRRRGGRTTPAHHRVPTRRRTWLSPNGLFITFQCGTRRYRRGQAAALRRHCALPSRLTIWARTVSVPVSSACVAPGPAAMRRAATNALGQPGLVALPQLETAFVNLSQRGPRPAG